jgi:undecaprenyl diphosphate synthase
MSRNVPTGSDALAGKPVPRHVAVIMDGNGRWAVSRGLTRTAGHRKGADAVRPVIEAAAEIGIEYITLFAFSAENWSRPQDEIDELMRLLRFYLRSEIAELNRRGVCVRVIGDRSPLSDDIKTMIERGETLTRDNKRIVVSIALNYGGRQDIVRAAQTLASEVWAGRIQPTEITEAMISQALYTADMPDPDLLIRTSGEQRISNFLLWQSAYTELVFVDILWPDFGKDDFLRAIDEYRKRDRRYGATASAG